MKKIQQYLNKISLSELPVFIEGETGTGKTILAREIHYLSRRLDSNFLKLDCATLPPSLVESELFGYEKGAFTGANETKPGIFETANAGTVFLDDIENLALPIQAKLLTVLEERKIRRVGGIKQIEVKFRLISASNDRILNKIRDGTFRRDLFYRLKGAKFYLPALRERKEDIIELADYFLDIFNRSNKCKKRLSKDIKSYLKSYTWPGNVRELKYALEEAAVKAISDEIYLENFSLDLQQVFMIADSLQNHLSLDELEKRYIEFILNSVEFYKPRAAKILGIGLNTLYRKLKNYEIKERIDA